MDENIFKKAIDEEWEMVMEHANDRINQKIAQISEEQAKGIEANEGKQVK